MANSKDALTTIFNNKDCINHLRLYQYDILFTQRVGDYIIENFKNNNITDKDLVIMLRGYISSHVLSLCKLREMIDFIKKSKKINFNNETEKFVNDFIIDTKRLISFRNHYIAHPLKNDFVKKTEYLLSIQEAKPYMSNFFQVSHGKIENGELISKITEQNEKLELYSILIDHIINCIPNID